MEYIVSMGCSNIMNLFERTRKAIGSTQDMEKSTECILDFRKYVKLYILSPKHYRKIYLNLTFCTTISQGIK